MEEGRVGGSARGVVVEIGTTGALVAFTDGTVLECDVMESAVTGPVALAPDDEVVVLREGGAGRPVVLGRIAAAVRRAAADPPATLVLEARENLTLRCGDGSITIRADGRILIKGRDLVSHARRMNRIKGGAVTIN
jgi:hypothetical protein